MKGDSIRAIDDFTQALRLTPGDADALYHRGLAYAHTGDYEDAIQDYSHVSIKPADVDALGVRGVAYTKEGDYDRAIRDFDQALLTNPRFGFGFGKRSIAYARKGEYGRAISDWSRWLWLKYGFLGITIRSVDPRTYNWSGSGLSVPTKVTLPARKRSSSTMALLASIDGEQTLSDEHVETSPTNSHTPR